MAVGEKPHILGVLSRHWMDVQRGSRKHNGDSSASAAPSKYLAAYSGLIEAEVYSSPKEASHDVVDVLKISTFDDEADRFLAGKSSAAETCIRAVSFQLESNTYCGASCTILDESQAKEAHHASSADHTMQSQCSSLAGTDLHSLCTSDKHYNTWVASRISSNAFGTGSSVSPSEVTQEGCSRLYCLASLHRVAIAAGPIAEGAPPSLGAYPTANDGKFYQRFGFVVRPSVGRTTKKSHPVTRTIQEESDKAFCSMPYQRVLIDTAVVILVNVLKYLLLQSSLCILLAVHAMMKKQREIRGCIFERMIMPQEKTPCLILGEWIFVSETVNVDNRVASTVAEGTNLNMVQSFTAIDGCVIEDTSLVTNRFSTNLAFSAAASRGLREKSCTGTNATLLTQRIIHRSGSFKWYYCAGEKSLLGDDFYPFVRSDKAVQGIGNSTVSRSSGMPPHKYREHHAFIGTSYDLATADRDKYATGLIHGTAKGYVKECMPPIIIGVVLSDFGVLLVFEQTPPFIESCLVDHTEAYSDVDMDLPIDEATRSFGTDEDLFEDQTAFDSLLDVASAVSDGYTRALDDGETRMPIDTLQWEMCTAVCDSVFLGGVVGVGRNYASDIQRAASSTRHKMSGFSSSGLEQQTTTTTPPNASQESASTQQSSASPFESQKITSSSMEHKYASSTSSSSTRQKNYDGSSSSMRQKNIARPPSKQKNSSHSFSGVKQKASSSVEVIAHDSWPLLNALTFESKATRRSRPMRALGHKDTIERRLGTREKGGLSMSLSENLPAASHAPMSKKPSFQLKIPPKIERKSDFPLLSGDSLHHFNARRHRFTLSIDRWKDSLKLIAREGGERAFIDTADEILIGIIVNEGIKILAVDFDLTITTTHTGGTVFLWDPLYARLGQLLSPQFNSFATKAEAKGLTIVIVTFTDNHFRVPSCADCYEGEELVAQVMEKGGATFHVSQVYGYNPRYWSEPENYMKLNLQNPMPLSKQYHLSRVRQEFRVSNDEILLIDDDAENCASAVASGVLTLRVLGQNGFKLLQLQAS